MIDRQVEAVAGAHVLIRVAGAVVLVAHRGATQLTGDSPATRAAEALAQLIFDAGTRIPAGPGRLVARETTRWLMRDAERISPGVPLDLGILSRADTGGVAIFLHGRVTAILAGADGTEYYRGVDAAFTVDRVAEEPARAIALFVDEEHGRAPELPDRGIGSLVEGTLPAAGAVVWFATPSRRDSGVAHRREAGQLPVPIPPPTAQLHEANSEVRTEQVRTGPAFDPYVEPTELSGPRGRTKPDDGSVRPPSVDLALVPDPAELERRLEATTRAIVPIVRVLGFVCARAHPSDPRAAFCTVCGMPVDQTQQPAEVVRPPLGMLMLDDGMTYLLATGAVIGREPESSDAAQRGLAPLQIEDASGGMSRAHAEIHLVDWDVTIVDRGSTNGTRVRLPGYRDWILLQPHQPLVLVQGAEISLGNRVFRFDPAVPPPFS